MHINNKDWQDFNANTMDTQDMIAFLEHLDKCDFCLDQMIHQEERSCSSSPGYLKEQIMARAASPEVTAAKKISDTSYKVQMFYRRVWTLAGMIAALFLLFTVNQIDFAQLQPRFSTQIEMEENMAAAETQSRNHLYDFTQEIGKSLSNGGQFLTGCLSDFSSKLLNGGK